MSFNELNNEQRRHFIDATQAYEAYLTARDDLARRFLGHMSWKTVAGKQYLYRQVGRTERGLGPRTPETEQARDAFDRGKAAAQEREASLQARLEQMAPVNRAMGLDRVPRLVARILRRLDQAGVLGEQVCVLGTNALYAYEAKAGVRFDSGLLATGDIDFGLDARRRLALAAKTMPRGLLPLLQTVDTSFSVRRDGDFRAVSKSGFLVELIAPVPRRPRRQPPSKRLGGATEADLEAAEVWKLEWVVEAPRFEAIAIDESGLPCKMVAADPRWFAAHKLWLATRPDRELLKKPRDAEQGRAVAALLAKAFPDLAINDGVLSQLPEDLRQALRAAWQESAPEVGLQW